MRRGNRGAHRDITFPDDKVFRFAPFASLNFDSNNICTGAGYMDVAVGAMRFYPLPGTVGTLRDLHAPDLLHVGFTFLGEPLTFHDATGNPGDGDDFGPLYDPKEFEFTTRDGRKFQFNEAGKVTLMIDRNGNSLEFTANGIIHTNSGKSVKFIRDAAGRIRAIYDPNGLNSAGQTSGPPALQFKYDGAGDLIFVHRLTTRNATNPAYVTTQFAYTNTNTSYPHYLTTIVDPRGVPGIRNEYADDGKLKSMTDASGKTINYIHDLSNRTEIVVDRLGNTNVFTSNMTRRAT